MIELLTIENILILLMVFVAGLCKGRADYIKEHNLDKDSWMNKWWWELSNNSRAGYRQTQDVKLWYYLWVFTPKYVEKFPYSSTALVWLTDEWHLMNMIMLSMYQFSIAFLILHLAELPIFLSIPIVLILKLVHGAGFWIEHK